jgi:glycosyltransferase involved in cell wall biosynthesis
MRIIIVADNASSSFGGEAFIPLNYFRILLARQQDVRLVVHARNKPELTRTFSGHLDRLYFVDDTVLHRFLFRLSGGLPRRLADSTTGLVIYLSTQWSQRRVVRELVSKYSVDVVHVPIPVSPKIPSLMWRLGAAVVIGPLNGGMDYPDAFRRERSRWSRLAFTVGRRLATLVNVMIPGKRRAEIILVANRRTREALPRGIAGRIVELVENGVDFSIWQQRSARTVENDPIRFIFVGRLIDWKALDLVLEATSRLHGQIGISLEIIGDGPMRESWQGLADQMGLNSVVRFSGWLTQEACALRMQEADVFVLPSLFECGGAVVLEAMAMGLPVIATAWGGPADYLDESCGILLNPSSREELITGFADAMTRLAMSPDTRKRLGQAGYVRARAHFDWERKIDQIMTFYQSAIELKVNADSNRQIA